MGLLLVASGENAEARPLIEACLAGLPFDILRARIGLQIADLYDELGPERPSFFEILPLFQEIMLQHSLKSLDLKALKVILDFGVGDIESARNGLSTMMSEHWPVWDRINRRTVLFALRLLAQSPKRLDGQLELGEWLDEIGE